MREHPIPTDITSYRFHIIGTMTLKQFGEVALGVVLAFIIYMTNLPVIIKWPLILFFAGLGAAAAFIPIAERPLDHWIITFYKALYKPTQFYWKRAQKIPDPFLYEQKSGTTSQPDEIDLTPYKRQRIKEYLHTVPTATKSTDFTDAENSRMQSILESFTTTPVYSTPTTPVHHQDSKPALAVRVREIKKPLEDVVEKKEIEMTTRESTLLTVSPPLPITNTEILSAVENNNLPIPEQPTQPNIIVGMVVNQQNELIPEAIIEIINEQNEVQRAIKTNALGQFFVTTPLKNGVYIMKVEKEGLSFDSHRIELLGQVVAPIEIRSL